MLKREVGEKLEKYNQQRLLREYETLSLQEQKELEEQLEQVDFRLLDKLERYRKSKLPARGKIEPIKAMQKKEIQEKRERFLKTGYNALAEGKVGAVLLAGGQGTRLGFDKPKGMFNIGVNREVFLFQRLIENLLDSVKKSGRYIYMAIMTSHKNHGETVRFFEEHNYFGYDRNYIMFFKQNMAPSVNFEGELLLEGKGKLSFSPNGNGGWFSSLLDSSCLNVLQEKGVEWLNVFSVDNVLQRIADPMFVGAVLESGCECGAKVVKKVSPDEKVGVMCKEDGRPSIVEYYELTDELKEELDESGEPAYYFGVILNYLFQISALERIVDHELPIHIVEKKIPYMNEEGELVSPKEPNGYKFEELILDMIHMLKDCLPYEVERDYEFAPVKNKEGADSVETARKLLEKNHIKI